MREGRREKVVVWGQGWPSAEKNNDHPRTRAGTAQGQVDR